MHSEEKYKPTWNSLKRHRNPEWLDDAKYGIYYHWGIYSVPEFGPKTAKNGRKLPQKKRPYENRIAKK